MGRRPRSTPPPQLRQKAETELARAPRDVAPVPAADQLLHELRVHQIELEMQNEELRRAQAALEESRDDYLDLYEFAPVGYLTLSGETQITAINLTGAALLGQDRLRVLRRRFEQFVGPDDRDRWHRFFLGAMRQKEQRTCELVMLRGDGSRFFARLDCVRREREPPVLRVALTDITEHRHVEEELRIAAIAFESQEGMIVTDPKGVFVRVNRAFTDLTGYSPAEAIGQTAALLNSGRQDADFYRRMWKSLRDTGYWQGEIWNRRKDGTIYAEWQTISAVKTPDGETSHYVVTFSEITKNLEAAAVIHRLAYFDALTHLPNRSLLHDRIALALAGSSRSRHYGALLFLDLDNFKSLNDTLGHDVGDQLLRETALRIQAKVRACDTVARLGGDEFVVMLNNLSTVEEEAAVQADRVGRKICEAIAKPFDFGGNEFHCTASLGITLFRAHEESAETLLKHADLAMYKAKHTGRNTLRFFDPAMQTALDQRSALEAELRQAVERGQLRLYYQAQVDEARQVVGAEALLRWEHPERGVLLPADFVPLAEETGLIAPIGRWVLETACAQIKAWSAAPATRALWIAVNVSPRQFRQPEFIAQTKAALERTGADPAHLKIELSESLLIADAATSIARMEALKTLGIGLSIDDFGTGDSSLAALRRLPLEQLKVARSFVHDVATDPGDAAIVQAIINMGRILGLTVIAEGVETEAQLSKLSGFGCVSYQGYLFARPMPLAEFERILAKQAGVDSR